MFDLLITPSAIREWWGTARVIVTPRIGGTWAAAWGDEDDPDYISAATLADFEPPRKLALKFGEYYAKSGELPFKFSAKALTTFTIEPDGEGCKLRVEQTGFPRNAIADDFYAACETGWKKTFDGIRNYLNSKFPHEKTSEAPGRDQMSRADKGRRRHELQEPFGVSPEKMFEVLTTPSAIRDWWGASMVVIDPRKGGSLVTAWGDGEKESEYVNSFEILEFDPPKRMLLGRGKYISGANWPIVTNMTTELVIESQPPGCSLRIVQELSPAEPLLDDFFEACVVGWQNSFEGIRNYLHNHPAE
jgi:uncharacterized protein YndB with AHSA1/START domain